MSDLAIANTATVPPPDGGTANEAIAGIAHDVNNMLGIVMGNLELARTGIAEGHVTTRAAGCLRRAELGARKAAALVAELLASGRPDVKPPIDANALIEELVSLLSRSLSSAIHVIVVLDADIGPVAVEGSELESALLNLCLNARDAMPGGGTLSLETAALASEPFVRISVSDTGVGMPPEVASRALEAFFTTKASKGTGLGLSRVATFARTSGGTVEIQSEEGIGTSVRLYLPVQMA